MKIRQLPRIIFQIPPKASGLPCKYKTIFMIGPVPCTRSDLARIIRSVRRQMAEVYSEDLGNC